MSLEEIDKKWTNSRIKEWALVRDSARDGTELDTYHILPSSFDENDRKDFECFLMYLPKLIAVSKAAKEFESNINRDYAQWKKPLLKALDDLERENEKS